MDENLLRSVYLALRTVPATGDSVRGIAAFRLILISAVGEERQSELIGQWNDVDIPHGELADSPRWLRFIAESGIALFWIEAGMPKDMAARLHHLFGSMLDLVQGDFQAENHLIENIALYLGASSPDFSNARIAANEIMARAIYQGDVSRIAMDAERVHGILSLWKAAEVDWGRDYELDEVSWIIKNVKKISRWSRQVRDRIEMARG